jgi:hypothetical protein
MMAIPGYLEIIPEYREKLEALKLAILLKSTIRT